MTVEVVTGPQWLADQFDGAVNSTNTAKIEVRYINGIPIISKNVLTDPTYAENMLQIVNGKPMADWLEPIEIEVPEE